MRVSPDQEQALKHHLARPLEPTDWLLEGVAALAVLLPTAYLLAVWSELPASVPTHFDGAGRPNAFGPRASIWGLVGAQLGLYLGLSLLPYLPVRYWNLPVKVTAKNLARVVTLLKRFPRTLKVAVGVLFGVSVVGTVRVALGRAGVLPTWLLGLGLLGVMAALAWLLLETARANRG